MDHPGTLNLHLPPQSSRLHWQASAFRARVHRADVPTLAKVAPQGGKWIHEIKYDGYRTQLVTDDGRLAAYSRRGKPHPGEPRLRSSRASINSSDMAYNVVLGIGSLIKDDPGRRKAASSGG